jgi:hypothetical protein
LAESAAQRVGPATHAETGAVYAAGVVQGIALVTFPAASTIFTDPSEYDLSSTQYAGLFVPQVLTAIAAALLGATLSGRFGIKRVYLAGLVAGLLSMSWRGDDGLARVELRHGDEGLDVWMDETYGNVMVFTGDPLPDVNRRSLAVEPMTCPPNAFRSRVDVVHLEPGDEVESVFGISQPTTRTS